MVERDVSHFHFHACPKIRNWKLRSERTRLIVSLASRRRPASLFFFTGVSSLADCIECHCVKQLRGESANPCFCLLALADSYSLLLEYLEGANSDKKMKKVSRNKKNRDRELPEAKTTELSHVNEDKNSAGMSDKKNKLKKKRRNSEDGAHADVPSVIVGGDDSNQQNVNLDGANSPKKMKKVARNKKVKGMEAPQAEMTKPVVSPTPAYVNTDKTSAGKKKNKLKKNKQNKQKRKEDGVHGHLLQSNEVGNQQIGKSKSIKTEAMILEDEDEVYQISSGDDDETTGMKRWIGEYKGGRPGAEILLQRINGFLVDYWAQKEKERKERESEAAEGGWTVVTHVKGRKKTTDVESGTTVGSVAQAAVMDNISKKKNKQIGLNFYRFQTREAQRNEIMTLQSKFEQDKKRIQQMRAARKFRPY